MLPLYQAEELTKKRHDSALTIAQRIQAYGRSTRSGRAHEALERLIEVDVQNGSHPGELNHELIAVLHRVAE